MARMTLKETEDLRLLISAELAHLGPVRLDTLREKYYPDGPKNRFTFFIKNRFLINNGIVYPEPPEATKKVSLDGDLRKMAKALDRMAKEIEALQRENARLRNMKGTPTLSERARAALVTYGD